MRDQKESGKKRMNKGENLKKKLKGKKKEKNN